MASSSGFFQGGMVEGIESANKQILAENKFAFDQGIQSRTIALAEQQAQAEQSRARLAEGDKLIGNYLTAMKDIATQGRDTGRIDNAVKLLKPLVAEVEAIAKINGRNPAVYTNQIQAILSGPTPAERARAEGAAAATKMTETARGLTDMGISREAAMETAGIKAPKGVEMLNFKVGNTYESVRADDTDGIQNILGRGGIVADKIDPGQSASGAKLLTFKLDNKYVSVRSDDTAKIDEMLAQGGVEATPVSSNKEESNATKTFMVAGKPVSVRADDTAGINDLIAKGGIETRISVQAANLGDAGGVTDVNKGDVNAARGKVRDLTSTLAEVEQAADAFKKNPEAGGVTGFLIDKIGGLVEQIPLGIGEEITSAAGVDTKGVQEARTRAQAVLGKLIGTITGDTSGRYSDRDMQAAKNAIPALEAKASPKQIQSAYKTIHKALDQSRMDGVEDLRVAAGIDDAALGTEEGVNKLGEILTKHRMKPDEAGKVISQIRSRLGIKGLTKRQEAPQPKTETKKEDQPPIAGAKKAADGKWYVEGPPGTFKRVERKSK